MAADVVTVNGNVYRREDAVRLGFVPAVAEKKEPSAVKPKRPSRARKTPAKES